MKEKNTPEKNAALQIPTAPPKDTHPTPKEGLTQAEAEKRAAAAVKLGLPPDMTVNAFCAAAEMISDAEELTRIVIGDENSAFSG